MVTDAPRQVSLRRFPESMFYHIIVLSCLYILYIIIDFYDLSKIKLFAFVLGVTLIDRYVASWLSTSIYPNVN